MTLLARQTPREAYRRVDFDARVEGADAKELVRLCCEQLVAAIGTAIHADGTGDNLLRSRSLTRALAAITALELGVSGEGAMADALRSMYGATRKALLDSVPAFDPDKLKMVRNDYQEISRALHRAA